MLRREGHPLGIRRAVATKAAAEEAESNSNYKRWTLGAAAGALIVAGTFAAGALGLSGAPTTTAGSVPDHAPAAPGHTPVDGGSVAGAPAPGQQDQQQPQVQPGQQPQQTQPSSTTNPQGSTAPSVPDANTGGGTAQTGGDGQRTTPGTSTPAPPAAPSTAPAPDPAPAPPAQEESQGGLLDTVGDVLTPVTGTVGGILSPSSSDTSTTTTKAAPAGPALTMIDPLADLLAS